MRKSRSVEQAVLNKPAVSDHGDSSLTRSTSRCKRRTRALASAAETLDGRVLTLPLSFSRMTASELLPEISDDPSTDA